MFVADQPRQVEVLHGRLVAVCRHGRFGQGLGQGVSDGLQRIGALVALRDQMRERVG